MIKTTLKVNVERFMKYVETQGNLLHELVKNALETNSGSVRVTYDSERFIVENTGDPVESEDELEEYFLTIFNTGKDESVNFGKGFSTVITEKKTMLFSGSYMVIINKWDDITIERNDEHVDGTRVVVFLKEDSPVKKMDIEKELSMYVTKKNIYFNGRKITTHNHASLSMLEKICDGMEGTVSSPLKGSFFRLIDGSLAPLSISDIPNIVSLVISDVGHVDSERTRLTWDSNHAFKTWFESKCDGTGIVVAQEDVDLVEKWMAFVADKCQEISGIDVEYGLDEYTLLDIIYAKRWCNFLNTIKEFGVYSGKMPDVPHMGKSYNMRMFCRKFFSPFPECFGGVKVGVLILDGTTQGPAYVEDLIQYKLYVDITISAFWEALNDTMPPLVATYIDPHNFQHCQFLSVGSWEVDNGVKVKTSPPDPSLILPRNAADKIKKEFTMSASPVRNAKRFEKSLDKTLEDIPSVASKFKGDVWVQTTHMGVPILKKESTDMRKVRFTRSIQAEKFRAWRNVVALLVEYLDIDAPIVPIIHINTGDKKLAFKVSGNGYTYITLSHLGTSLPDTKRRRGLYLLMIALHELCHLYYKGHGPKFTSLFEGWYSALVKTKGFLRDLVGVL